METHLPPQTTQTITTKTEALRQLGVRSKRKIGKVWHLFEYVDAGPGRTLVRAGDIVGTHIIGISGSIVVHAPGADAEIEAPILIDRWATDAMNRSLYSIAVTRPCAVLSFDARLRHLVADAVTGLTELGHRTAARAALELLRSQHAARIDLPSLDDEPLIQASSPERHLSTTS